MKTIIYTCPYVPAEWIAAHGLHADRLLLDHVDSGFLPARTEGVCPYVRSFVGEVMNNRVADGAVVTTVCDQMRRAFDIIVRNCDLPAFLMNVPSTWQTLTAQKLYVDELKRLSRFLVGLGGESPSQDTLAEIMLEYDDARTFIRSTRGRLSARRFAEAIAAGGSLKGEAFGDGSSDSGHPQPVRQAQGSAALEAATLRIPLAIVGGPMMKPDFDLFDTIEQLGGRVVLDATETGERGMCPKFDRRRLAEDPLLELAHAYFAGIPDASRRPNSELYTWLKRELADRAVRGIIFRRYLWCDLWHAELGRLKDWSDLPVLDIDSAGDNERDLPRIQNRIRAFMEMLQ
jgi:benzoyl-CoA reductase/2-hydroxyglutaryl-CoA dehydratase subunit BcrC/BadD/HgdB